MSHCLKSFTKVLYLEGDIDILQSCMSVPLSKEQEYDILDVAPAATAIGSNKIRRTHSDVSSNESRGVLIHSPRPSFTTPPSFNNGVGSDSVSPFPISLKGGSSGSPRRSGKTAVSASCNSTQVRIEVNESRAVESQSGGRNIRSDILKQMGESSFDWKTADSDRKVVEVAVHRIAGPPRMWQRAVMLASGYEEYSPDILILKGADSNIANSKLNCLKTSRIPPIVLFLLSDAESLLDRSWGKENVSLQQSQILPASSGQNLIGGSDVLDKLEAPLDSISASIRAVKINLDAHKCTAYNNVNMKDCHSYNHIENEKLHSTAFLIWQDFQSWGLNPHKKKLITIAERGILDNIHRATVETYKNKEDSHGNELYLLARKDPIYSMILEAIIEYRQFLTRFSTSFQCVAKLLSQPTCAPSDLSTSFQKGAKQRLSLSYNGISGILNAACVALKPDRIGREKGREGKSGESKEQKEERGKDQIKTGDVLKEREKLRLSEQIVSPDSIEHISDFSHSGQSFTTSTTSDSSDDNVHNDIHVQRNSISNEYDKNKNKNKKNYDNSNNGKNNYDDNNDDIAKNKDNGLVNDPRVNTPEAFTITIEEPTRKSINRISKESNLWIPGAKNSSRHVLEVPHLESSLGSITRHEIRQMNSPERSVDTSDSIRSAQKRSLLLDKLLKCHHVEEQIKIVEELKLLDSKSSIKKNDENENKNENENDVTRKSFERKMHDSSCDRINDKNICNDPIIESQFKSSGKVIFFLIFVFYGDTTSCDIS